MSWIFRTFHPARAIPVMNAACASGTDEVPAQQAQQ